MYHTHLAAGRCSAAGLAGPLLAMLHAMTAAKQAQGIVGYCQEGRCSCEQRQHLGSSGHNLLPDHPDSVKRQPVSSKKSLARFWACSFAGWHEPCKRQVRQ